MADLSWPWPGSPFYQSMTAADYRQYSQHLIEAWGEDWWIPGSNVCRDCAHRDCVRHDNLRRWVKRFIFATAAESWPVGLEVDVDDDLVAPAGGDDADRSPAPPLHLLTDLQPIGPPAAPALRPDLAGERAAA